MGAKKNRKQLNKFADFSQVAINEKNPKYLDSSLRLKTIYKKDEDKRSPFERDSHRILHSNAYRRLKHKTQVFFATHNDHVCTRIEHVAHVSSIASTIAKFLNLNLELVQAIATGHDLGHAPFGHQGEYILRDIAEKNEIDIIFWHEKNSLHFIDEIETLPDYDGYHQNLNLTYAVRDGIICHCGEVDDQYLKPREDCIDLSQIEKAGTTCAYTYEGCVVKVADKIAYIGRDIEDAIAQGILTENQTLELEQILEQDYPNIKLSDINTTVLIHKFIIDLCNNSTPEKGLCFSKDCFEMMKRIKKFNYDNIYNNDRLKPFKNYATLIIKTIFDELNSYDNKNLEQVFANESKFYPTLIKVLEEWIVKYSNYNLLKKEQLKYKNKIVYDINNKKDYQKAILDFISGMSDNFAISIFNEITSF